MKVPLDEQHLWCLHGSTRSQQESDTSDCHRMHLLHDTQTRYRTLDEAYHEQSLSTQVMIGTMLLIEAMRHLDVHQLQRQHP